MLTVYHGSIVAIEHPLVKVGRPNLDFGQGFYLTDIRNQAIDWADRIGRRMQEPPLLNIYELDIEQAQTKYRILKFEEYDKKWLDFIVANRSGEAPWKEYDLIIGGVANDRVIDTVESYMIGNITEDRALGQLAEHRPNNQLCITNQSLVDECLRFVNVEPVNLK